MGQLTQVSGSLLILLGFALTQLRLTGSKSVLYLGVNTVGSTVLSIDAFAGEQWGFLLLEGAWAAMSLGALISHHLCGVLRGKEGIEGVAGRGAEGGKSARNPGHAGDADRAGAVGVPAAAHPGDVAPVSSIGADHSSSQLCMQPTCEFWVDSMSVES
jgi:hypothetical protein